MMKAADRMRALCSRREYCVSDIRKKLDQALGRDKERVDEVLSVLVRDGYVDEARYAEAYARDKSLLAGWGCMKIRYMLASKGISDEIVRNALNGIDTDRAEVRMEKVLIGKCRSLKDDKDLRTKLIRFGMGRGYDYEDISRFLERYKVELNLRK
ncbi:MAG: RecX family transcriptional regulator [Bacteroidales bacterium]|nr:RecX family transcriptional regulator [Bacteroidales bacterium]